jgi:hypothetical protein
VRGFLQGLELIATGQGGQADNLGGEGGRRKSNHVRSMPGHAKGVGDGKGAVSGSERARLSLHPCPDHAADVAPSGIITSPYNPSGPTRAHLHAQAPRCPLQARAHAAHADNAQHLACTHAERKRF